MSQSKNLLLRTISGLLFIGIVTSSILWSPYSFLFVFIIFTIFGTYEFHKVTNKTGEIDVSYLISGIGAFILFICSFLHAWQKTGAIIWSVYGVFILSCILIELFRRKKNPINNWAYLLLGQVFIALPFSLLNYILFIEGFQPHLLLTLFVALWANDTGAYSVGVLMGKHKLFERVSPKKTWEGFLGGLVCTLFVGYLISRIIPDVFSVWQWLIFSLLVVILGTLGDLCESLLKRTENIKDAGRIIPGHGGILDRFDSMLLTAPIILIYFRLILFHIY